MGTERYRDFDTARAERNAEPVVFRLRGEEFKCVPALPVGALIDNVRDDGSRAIIKTAQWVRDLLIDDADQLERFNALLYQKHDPVEPSELDQIALWLLEVLTGRPFAPSSSSDASPPPSGDASSPNSDGGSGT